MEIPAILFLEDEDGNAVEMDVIGAATTSLRGEQRTYLALFPADSPEGDESTATVVRFLDDGQGIVAIEDDTEFEVALAALDMDSGEEPEDLEITRDSGD
ncbi:MAG: DUF1292 domain-containing protein [Cyanobacteria bacterium REEB65]|nr:DUF1292 domain-containing protein [Cyanobacteria bacterium REEB65]